MNIIKSRQTNPIISHIKDLVKTKKDLLNIKRKLVVQNSTSHHPLQKTNKNTTDELNNKNKKRKITLTNVNLNKQTYSLSKKTQQQKEPMRPTSWQQWTLMLATISFNIRSQTHTHAFNIFYHKRILFFLQLTFIPIKFEYVYTILTHRLFILSERLKTQMHNINIRHLSALIEFYKEKVQSCFSSRINWKQYKKWFIPMAYLHDMIQEMVDGCGE